MFTSPTPPTSRRRTKRIPISSAIPLLPPVEQKTGHHLNQSQAQTVHTKVYANHFPVQVAPNLMLYQYDAIIEKSSFRSPGTWEEALSRDQRRRFMQQLAENNVLDFIYW